MNQVVKVVINIVVFILFLSMVILGQKNIGVAGLCIQLVGLIGLLTQLFLFNKKNK